MSKKVQKMYKKRGILHPRILFFHIRKEALHAIHTTVSFPFKFHFSFSRAQIAVKRIKNQSIEMDFFFFFRNEVTTSTV